MRKIVHIDMDAFFASIEQRDRPELLGHPVAVGGQPEGRGVVAAASYEARGFGVCSAMPSAQAAVRCPKLIFIKPRMHVYRSVSKEIMAIFREITPLVEPLSLDEAYLDVTENALGESSAGRTAVVIKERIHKATGLRASAGAAPNKFLAKIASDMEKPNGLTIIPPHRIDQVLLPLGVRKIPGVGAKTELRLRALGILSVADLRVWSEENLCEHFGKSGHWFFNAARGIDEREVVPSRQVKSVSVETTFAQDLTNYEQLSLELEHLSTKLALRLERKEVQGRTITLKATYGDFTKITRSDTFDDLLWSAEGIAKRAQVLLTKTEAGSRSIRLLGLSVSNLNGVLEDKRSEAVIKTTEPGPKQLSFPFK